MKPGLYKFVQINGKEIRFLEVVPLGPSHKSLVKPGEKATAAGWVSIFDDYWRLSDTYSISLCIGCNNSIIPILSEVIGKIYFDNKKGLYIGDDDDL
jgi:hypothetical protein